MKSGITAKQPVSIWRKPVNAAPKALAVALSKATIEAVAGKWDDAANSIAEGLNALGFGTEPAELAWTLIHRALLRSSFELMKEAAPRLTLPKENVERVINGITAELSRHDLTIDSRFFDRPAELPFLKESAAAILHLLTSFGIKATHAAPLTDRLPSYFTFALVTEWREHAGEYEQLRAYLETPFSRAAEREIAWRQYTTWLLRQVDEPLFDELFGLRQIYVPLRGYYEVNSGMAHHANEIANREGTRTRSRVVVDLSAEVERWLDRADPHDAIRVLSGGPGSGKSSFAKMLAAQVASTNRKVLLIPLHRFEPADDIVDAVAEYLKYDQFLLHNPLDPKSGDPNVFVIFDGLDELSMQGKLAAEVAQKFVREIERKSALLNAGGVARFQSLIIGRELTIQANASDFRQEGQVLHALPYYVPPSERKVFNWVDPDKLMPVDQRTQWWNKYGMLTGRKYSRLPVALARDELVEVTAQPLLNYLIALSYGRKKAQFSREFNLNAMYSDLLLAVYERGWAGGKHAALRNLDFNGFVRVLEEIALATWHGDGRTTTVREIEEHCVSSGLAQLLDIFQEGAKVGVTRLLTAFYFRQRGQHASGDKTFEFTHKSFGEYLTALRLMRHLEKTAMMLKRRQESVDDGWDERTALVEWIPISGPTGIDGYILDFISREMLLRDQNTVEKSQQVLDVLIESAIRYGIPMEKTAFPSLFNEQMQWAKNTNETLMTLRSRCATITGRPSSIAFETPAAFGTWLAWVAGQRGAPVNAMIYGALNHLVLDRTILYCRDFFAANLAYSSFSGALLDYANFTHADLEGADFSAVATGFNNFTGAHLKAANFHGARLINGNFRNANLQYFDGHGARFTNCVFDGADITNAEFGDSDVDLTTAFFDGARMNDVEQGAWAAIEDADQVPG